MNLAEYSNRHILTQIRSKTKKEKRKVIYQIQREPFSWSLFKKEKKGVENLIQKRSNSHRLSLSLSLYTSQALRNITIKRVKVLGNFKRHERKEKRKSKIFEKTRLVEEKKKKRCSRPKLHSFFIFFLFKFSDTYFPNQKVIFFIF